MNQKDHSYTRAVYLLIAFSALVRGILAAAIELGNDEVYYRLYALFPDWSHFDHPPMVGWVMQLFSLNMLLQDEFFLRLGPVAFGAVNTWVIFRVGRHVKNERTGFFAALLYVSSVYATVICGVFILPDTPQSLFWLLALYLTLLIFPEDTKSPHLTRNLLLLGLVTGLGILSKYTTVFLWLGIALYLLLFDRKWLRVKAVYASLGLALLLSLPILIWNIQHDFISFTFHSNRVDVAGYGINPASFFRELAGEFLYNNPVNVVVLFITFGAVLRSRLKVRKAYQHILVLVSLPLIFSFLLFSIFRETLPHWSAQGYSSLIVLSAAMLDQLNKRVAKNTALAALVFVTIVLVLGLLQINHGIFRLKQTEEYARLGKNDPSLDLYGYEQVGEAFGRLVRSDLEQGVMPEGSALIGDNWFPLANYDYYAARPLGMPVYGLAGLEHLHKYAWVNRDQGGLKRGMSGYYLTDSKYYRPPNALFRESFESVEAADTIPVYRSGRIVKRAFVWRLKNMVSVPNDPLQD